MQKINLVIKNRFINKHPFFSFDYYIHEGTAHMNGIQLLRNLNGIQMDTSQKFICQAWNRIWVIKLTYVCFDHGQSKFGFTSSRVVLEINRVDGLLLTLGILKPKSKSLITNPLNYSDEHSEISQRSVWTVKKWAQFLKKQRLWWK